MEREEIPNFISTQRGTTNSDDKQQTANPNTCISLNKYLEQLLWIFIPRSELLQFQLYVVVLMGYMAAATTNFIKLHHAVTMAAA